MLVFLVKYQRIEYFEGLAYLPVFYPKENVIVHEVVKLHDLFPLICQAKAFDWRSFIDVV